MSERKNSSMNNESNTNSIILVVEDVSETRDGIEKLLKADGYRVALLVNLQKQTVAHWARTKVS